MTTANPFTLKGVCDVLGITPQADVMAVRLHVEPRESWIDVVRQESAQRRRIDFDTANDGSALCQLLALPPTAVSGIDIEIAEGAMPSLRVNMLAFAAGREAFSDALTLIGRGKT